MRINSHQFWLASENRLCRKNDKVSGYEALGTAAESIGTSITSSMESYLQQIKASYGKGLEEQKKLETENNLRDETQWINAFNPDNDLLKGKFENGKYIAVVPKQPVPINQVLTPEDILKNMTLVERQQAFIRLMRSMVPDTVREQFGSGHKVITAILSDAREALLTLTPAERQAALEPINQRLKKDRGYDPELVVIEVTDSATGQTIWVIDDPNEVNPQPGTHNPNAMSKDQAEAQVSKAVNTIIGAAGFKLKGVNEQDYTAVEHNIFADRGFFEADSDLAKYFSNSGEKLLKTGNAESLGIKTMQEVQKLLVGQEVENASQLAIQIARKTLLHYYGTSEMDAEGGKRITRRQRDFNDLARTFKLTRSQLLQPRTFLDPKIPPSRFKAAVRLGIIDENFLAFLARSSDQRTLDRNAEFAAERKKLDEARAPVERRRARELNNSISENFSNLSTGMKALFIGLGIWGGWKMLTSKSGWVRSIPFIGGGILAYQMLVRGNMDALDDGGKALQKGMQALTDRFEFLGKVTGILGKENENLDAYLSDIQNFFESNPDLEIAGVAASMAAISQVPMSMLHKGIDHQTGTFDASKNRALMTTILETQESEASRSKLRNLLQSETNQKGLYEALERIFFLSGPQSDPSRYNFILDKVATYNLKSIPEDFEAKDANGQFLIPDETERKDTITQYRLLVMAGDRFSITGGNGDLRLIDFVRTVIKPAIPEGGRFENAEPIKNPLENKTAESDTYEKARTTLENGPLNTREALLADEGPLAKEVAETLDRYVTMGIIEKGSVDGLIRRFKKLRENSDASLAEIYRDTEELKQGILTMADNSDELPLKPEDIVKLEEAEQGTILQTVAGMFNRNIYTVYRGFMGQYGIDDLLPTLSKERSIHGQGLEDLIEKLTAYKTIFDQMKVNGHLNPDLIADIGIKLGSEDQAQLFLARLFMVKDYEKFGSSIKSLPIVQSERVEDMERYFANRMANSILEAILSQHRSNGQHAPVTDPKMRFISVTEEQNLINEAGVIFREIAGNIDDDGEPIKTDGKFTRGSFEVLDILDGSQRDFEAAKNIEFRAVEHRPWTIFKPFSMPQEEIYEDRTDDLRKLGTSMFALDIQHKKLVEKIRAGDNSPEIVNKVAVLEEQLNKLKANLEVCAKAAIKHIEDYLEDKEMVPDSNQAELFELTEQMLKYFDVSTTSLIHLQAFFKRGQGASNTSGQGARQGQGAGRGAGQGPKQNVDRSGSARVPEEVLGELKNNEGITTDDATGPGKLVLSYYGKYKIEIKPSEFLGISTSRELANLYFNKALAEIETGLNQLLNGSLVSQKSEFGKITKWTVSKTLVAGDVEYKAEFESPPNVPETTAKTPIEVLLLNTPAEIFKAYNQSLKDGTLLPSDNDPFSE